MRKIFTWAIGVFALVAAGLPAFAEGSAVDTLIGTIGTAMGITIGLVVAASGVLYLAKLGYGYAKTILSMGKH